MRTTHRYFAKWTAPNPDPDAEDREELVLMHHSDHDTLEKAYAALAAAVRAEAATASRSTLPPLSAWDDHWPDVWIETDGRRLGTTFSIERWLVSA